MAAEFPSHTNRLLWSQKKQTNKQVKNMGVKVAKTAQFVCNINAKRVEKKCCAFYHSRSILSCNKSRCDKGAMSNYLLSFWKAKMCLCINRPLPSPKNPHFQNEARCTTFLVQMSFICMRMKNDFHIKGWAPTLVLKQRPGGTRKWSVTLQK